MVPMCIEMCEMSAITSKLSLMIVKHAKITKSGLSLAIHTLTQWNMSKKCDFELNLVPMCMGMCKMSVPKPELPPVMFQNAENTRTEPKMVFQTWKQ